MGNDGKVIIPAIYTKLNYYFRAQIYIVKRDGKYGIVSKEGKERIPLIYDKLKTLNNEVLKATINSKTGVIDYDGGIKVTLIYDDVDAITTRC